LIAYFLLWPLSTISLRLSDPQLKDGHIPDFIFRMHRSLAPKYEQWARHRVASGRAAHLDVKNVAATEWPVFGSAFFLWATEALQDAWEETPSRSPVAPAVYARGAIAAATELVLDEGHATWVRNLWGENYLHKENCFYRMLVINATVCYQKLLGDSRHESLLRDQVESLAREIEASPHGLIDDYPGECFPSDVIAAVAAIRRADAILGTDHEAFCLQSLRGFTGTMADAHTGLPPYMADSKGGQFDEIRGTTSQWACAWAPLLWPDTARDWYRAFEATFWQEQWGAVGFREFPSDQTRRNWTFDVDAGPIVGGLALATTAFSIGAARVNGRFDHAYPLSAEVIAMSWPLPDGTLLLPRILSGSLDAPYVGEAAILFNFTRQTPDAMQRVNGGTLPPVVFGAVAMLLAAMLVELRSIVKRLRRMKAWIGQRRFPVPRTQFALWFVIVLAGLWVFSSVHLLIGLLLICSTQLLPIGRLAQKKQ
jgi:hypothetical protein